MEKIPRTLMLRTVRAGGHRTQAFLPEYNTVPVLFLEMVSTFTNASSV